MPRSAWCWTCWTGSTSSKPRSATRPERGSEPRMDMNRLTQKSQAAMQEAQALAVRHGHTEVDGEHLLLALLDQPEGLLPRLVTQLGADPAALLDVAEREAKRLKDEYVSVEHLVLALAEEGNSTPAGRRLAEYGVTREAFLSALTRIRGNQRVTSASPEAAYEALEKYGQDLVASARAGRLDPVIGRDAEIRRVIQILSRKSKNNPVLIGDPGVGKTAIVEGLAQRILGADVP